MPEEELELSTLEEKPEAAVIDRYRARLSEIWQPAHSEWNLDDDMYFRRYDVWDDPETRAQRPSWLRPSRPTSIIDHAVDHQLASEPRPHREPIGDYQDAQKNASSIEKAMGGIFAEAALMEPVLTPKAAGKYLVHLGYAVLEYGLDSTVMGRRRRKPVRADYDFDEDFEMAENLFENQKKNMMPFRIRAPHPARVLLDPWEKRPPLAIRHFRRSAQELEDLTLAWKAMGRNVDVFRVQKNKPYEMLMVDEWWTDSWHAMKVSGRVAQSSERMIDGSRSQMLFNIRNPWGFTPYAHGYAGFGMESTNEMKVDPKEQAVGLLRSVRADLKAQAQSVNARHHSVIDGSYRPYTVDGMSPYELQAQLDESNIIDVTGGVVIGELDSPKFDRRMFEEESWLSDDIEDGTFARDVAGKRQTGVSTVGQQVILSQAAGKKFVSVGRQLEHLFGIMGSYILQAIDAQKMKLRVRGHEISYTMLEGDYNFQVAFNHVDPVIQMQNREIGMREVMAGLKSKATYWSADSLLEDGAGEETRLLVDWINSQPMIHQELALLAAREMGVEEILLRAIDREKQKKEQGSGLVDAQGRPTSSSTDPINKMLTGETVNPDQRGNVLA